MIKDARPFGDFSKPGMLDVLNLLIPGYKPQERHTVAKHLSKQYKIYRKYLTEYLSHIKHLALTTDMWKSKHLTHFFDDDFNYVSLTLKDLVKNIKSSDKNPFSLSSSSSADSTDSELS